MPPKNKQRAKNASAMKLVGQLLANYRQHAGYTQESLATDICADGETIASIEQGRRPLKTDLAAELDDLLCTKGSLSVAVRHLPQMDKYPLWAEEFMDREKEAIAHYSYENQVMPGLLQTEAYARAVFRSRVPSYTEEEIEEKVAARLERQAILRRKNPPTISFVIFEPVLLMTLGGPETRKEQLRHIRECADIPGVTIQVLPLARATHAGLNGPFVILETPDHERLGYMETQLGSQHGGQLVSAPDQVSELEMKYAMLRTQALTAEATKTLLDQLLGDA